MKANSLEAKKKAREERKARKEAFLLDNKVRYEPVQSTGPNKKTGWTKEISKT